jgi:hypothetical protein
LAALEDEFCTDEVYNNKPKETKTIETQTLESGPLPHHQKLVLITTFFDMMTSQIKQQLPKVTIFFPC